MYRVLRPFELFEPATVGEATQILFARGAGAKVLAGGVDLVMKMRTRKIEPGYVVSLKKIPQLNGITGDGDSGLRIGALATLRSIELSAAAQNYPVLCQGINSISSIQVKNMGTAVGNLCVATPATDVAPPLFVLGAKLKIAGVDGEKLIPIEDFYAGVNKTVLASHEIVTEIILPGVCAGTGMAFLKIGKTGATIAKVNAAVLLVLADGKCTEARIALGAVAPAVIRAAEAETVLKGEKVDDGLIEKAAATATGEASPITDFRSTAEYRRVMIKALVKDALHKAVAEAGA